MPLLTESDDVMQALIRDIQLARHNIEMVFYIWQPGGMAEDHLNIMASQLNIADQGLHDVVRFRQQLQLVAFPRPNG
jgi:cardiolipin synthase